jgi:hypothetical protein
MCVIRLKGFYFLISIMRMLQKDNNYILMTSALKVTNALFHFLNNVLNTVV